LKGGQYEWARQVDRKMKHYDNETYYENGKVKCEVWEVKD